LPALNNAAKAIEFILVLVCALPAEEGLASCYESVGAVQHRFQLSEGEAVDRKTGLTWKRCSVGKVWEGRYGCAGETKFVSLDEAKKVAKAEGPAWHVPSGPELESIIDVGCGMPVVDTVVFPDIKADEDGTANYWTTNEVGAANLVYFFDFMTGAADGHSRGFHLAVRLVKAAR
jgi:Protein of unknown function (DUF1566)